MYLVKKYELHCYLSSYQYENLMQSIVMWQLLSCPQRVDLKSKFAGSWWEGRSMLLLYLRGMKILFETQMK